MNELPKLFMMIGIPGSGKTTEAELIAKEYDANIHSSDKLREELFHDVNHQADNTILFNELHNRIIKDIENGKNTIFDATNINSKKRTAFLKRIKSPCEKIAIIMATPFEACIHNNQARDRQVPFGIMDRMYRNFQVPYYHEGFDTIQIVLHQDSEVIKSPLEVIDKYKDYDQKNEHHKLTLGEHLNEAFNYVVVRLAKGKEEYTGEIAWAALLHDIGKPYCQEFKEDDPNAHYYNHPNVSAYDSFFYTATLNNCDNLLIAWLINNHMQPFNWKFDERLRNKRKDQWGEELVSMIELLHEADVCAH